MCMTIIAGSESQLTNLTRRQLRRIHEPFSASMTMKHESQLNILIKDLHNVEDSKTIGYNEAKLMNTQCVYIVKNSVDEIVYVGRTGRTGKLRLREMGTDFRSHTLNRKLLKSKLNSLLENTLDTLQNSTKNELICHNRLTLPEFQEAQQYVNKQIKDTCKFILYQVDQERLNEVEHFFISVFKPRYND